MPLYTATLLGHYDSAKVLLRAGADPSTLEDSSNRKTSTLHLAASGFGQPPPQFFALLLKHATNIGTLDSKGHSPLFFAARKGDTLEYLLSLTQESANPDIGGIDNLLPQNGSCFGWQATTGKAEH